MKASLLQTIKRIVVPIVLYAISLDIAVGAESGGLDKMLDQRIGLNNKYTEKFINDAGKSPLKDEIQPILKRNGQVWMAYLTYLRDQNDSKAKEFVLQLEILDEIRGCYAYLESAQELVEKENLKNEIVMWKGELKQVEEIRKGRGTGSPDAVSPSETKGSELVKIPFDVLDKMLARRSERWEKNRAGLSDNQVDSPLSNERISVSNRIQKMGGDYLRYVREHNDAKLKAFVMQVELLGEIRDCYFYLESTQELTEQANLRKVIAGLKREFEMVDKLQVGAEQLTTAPELKPEGKDQPESKVAPR